MIVMKFGGTSVATARAMRQVAQIVNLYRDRQPVVVVSALAGVTDSLVALAAAQRVRNYSDIDEGLTKLCEQHRSVLGELLGEEQDSATQTKLESLLVELERAARLPPTAESDQPRQLDQLVSFGERLSTVLVTAALRQAGLRARDFDARGFLFTDGQHGAAIINFTLTNLATASTLQPYIEECGVPVVTGFIGSAPDGSVTTLARGGSDYTATVLGAALQAEEVWLWKEEDGIMTADPRIVPEAQLLAAITYREAAEMSSHGAKVLHPLAIVPVRQPRIPVRVRNTFKPEAAGTLITESVEPPKSGVRVITAIQNLSLVAVEGLGMTGLTGLAAEVTGLAKQARVNIVMSMQAASEQNICLICRSKDSEALAEVLRAGLRERMAARLIDQVRVEDDMAAIVVVGEGMRGRKGVAGRVFSAVCGAEVNVSAIVQGPSECNITFLVQKESADDAVRALHTAFDLGLVGESVAVGGSNDQ